MHMYVLQIKPGYDPYAIRELRRAGYDACAPQRVALHRRGGTWWETDHYVFPGYAFVRTLLSDGDYKKIMGCAGVVRFLGCGSPEALQPHEEQYIDWLHNGGEIIQPSEIHIRADGSMMYVAGVICNFAGREIRHNTRQCRAVVPIKIAGKLHNITLAVRYTKQNDLMTDAGVDSSPTADQDCMMPAT